MKERGGTKKGQLKSSWTSIVNKNADANDIDKSLINNFYIIFIHFLWWNITVLLILSTSKIYFDITVVKEPSFELKYRLWKSNSV